MQALFEHGIWIPIEGMVNQVLTSSPKTQQSLCQYEGKQVRVSIKPKLELDVLILNQGIRLGRLHSEAQAEIRAHSFDFLSLLSSKDSRKLLESAKFELSGEQELIFELASLLDELDVDWIGLLQPYTGSFMAEKVSTGLAKLAQFGSQIPASSFVLKDFLEQETSKLASHKQIQSFSQQVKELDGQIQALSQRIKQITPSIKPRSGGANQHG